MVPPSEADSEAEAECVPRLGGTTRVFPTDNLSVYEHPLVSPQLRHWSRAAFLTMMEPLIIARRYSTSPPPLA